MSFYCEPVIGNKFFAREDISSILLKSSRDIVEGYRHNIAVIGRGLIGKTSLLLHFLNLIKDYDRLIPVYVCVRGIGFAGFADNIITMLLYHSLKRVKKLTKPHELSYLKKCARKLLPKTYDLIKRVETCIKEGNFDDAYSTLWDLCVVINSESGGFPIIVLDEFDQISVFPVKRPFQILGQKIMVQQRTLFIFSSSSPLAARRVLSEKLSLLFGGFDILDIGPFTEDQARSFIRHECSGIVITDELMDFLIFFTGSHPFYLSSVIQKLIFAKRCGIERISSKYLSIMIAELLFYPTGAMNQFFSQLLEQLRAVISYRDIIYILKELLAASRISDIFVRCKISSLQLHNLLNSLLEVGIVAKSGSLYAITDAAFRIWVEVKTRPSNLCFDFILHDDADSYAKGVEEQIKRFKDRRKKKFDEKIVELITSFNNDLFFIDQRIRTLPRLKFVLQQRVDSGSIFILATGKRRWLFVLSHKGITEEDIYTILRDIKELKYNDTKVILLASSGIASAAKLLAKQKLIWTWNRDDIERLFKFYRGYSTITA